MSKARPSTAITGAAGEFYVASYLSALGLVVALPRGGVPSSDLLVTTPEGNNTISLQVKTATKPDNSHGKYGKYLTWSVSSKSKDDTGNSHWYAFVALYDWPQSGKPPEIYFVPSKDVVDLLKTDWNKEDGTMLFFPIFLEINSEAEKYAPVKNNAAYYNGLEGFRKIEDVLRTKGYK